MKKYLLALLALLVVSGAALPLQAEEVIGFDLGVNFYKPSEKTTKSMGGGSFLAITLPPIDDKTTIGFYQEGLDFKLKDDKAGAPGTTVDINVNIDAIQITRVIDQKFTLGMHLGMADITAFDTVAAVLTLDDSVPLVDIFVKWSILKGGRSHMTANLGYRVLRASSFDPDVGADFIKVVSDLSGFFMSLSVGFRF